MNPYLEILLWLSICIQFLPVIISFFYKAFNSQLKALYSYFFLSILTDLFNHFQGYFHLDLKRLPLHIFTILEALLILYVYFKELKIKKAYPMLGLGTAFLIFAISRLSRTEYNDAACTIEAIMIIFFSIAYFFKMSDDLNSLKFTDHYFFWINSAFLFYFSFNLLLFFFGIYFPNVSGSLWAMHDVANIIYNILLIVGIIKTKNSLRILNNTNPDFGKKR